MIVGMGGGNQAIEVSGEDAPLVGKLKTPQGSRLRSGDHTPPQFGHPFVAEAAMVAQLDAARPDHAGYRGAGMIFFVTDAWIHGLGVLQRRREEGQAGVR
jgi:hypothetical protein